ncbi:SURF1 family protein [Beijerinckia mobilis]|uniref:SURF1 family protein n=1 Tax=Beijerinckia mobilis TaxID=231434 RepID=UPI000557F65F|nr:SURF1 family protein [Beijerinckia mobilis]
MRLSRRLIIAAFLSGAAFLIMIGLGVWQLQRLAWKEDLIAKIAERAKAPPQALATQDQWPKLIPDAYDYRHVRLAGSFLPGRDRLVFRGSANTVAAGMGPGYLVMTPFALESGGIVIVNRGFVPVAARNDALLPEQVSPTPTTLTGLMRPPEPRNPFTPQDQPEKGEFFTRDPEEIAASMHLTEAAPFTIDLDPLPPEAAAKAPWPHPGTTEIHFPNNHLSYALTWFGLAIGMVLVLYAYAWKERKSKTEAGQRI